MSAEWLSLELEETGDVPHISFPSGELESKRTAPSGVSASEQWGGSTSKGHQVFKDSLPLFCSELFPERARKAVRGPLIYSFSLCVPPAAAAVLKTIARERHTEEGSWESTSPSFLPLLFHWRFVFCFCGTSGAGAAAHHKQNPKNKGRREFKCSMPMLANKAPLPIPSIQGV